MQPYHKSIDSYLQMSQNNNTTQAPGPQPYRNSYHAPENTAEQTQEQQQQQLQSTNSSAGTPSRRQYVYPDVSMGATLNMPPPLAAAATMPANYQYNQLLSAGTAYTPMPYNAYQPPFSPGAIQPFQQDQQLYQQQQMMIKPAGWHYRSSLENRPQMYQHSHSSLDQTQTQSAPISPAIAHYEKPNIKYQNLQQLQQVVQAANGGARPQMYGQQMPVPQLIYPAQQQVALPGQSPLSAPSNMPIPMTIPEPMPKQNHNRFQQGFLSGQQSPQAYSHSPQNQNPYTLNLPQHSPQQQYPQRYPSRQSSHSRPQSRPHSRPHSRPSSPQQPPQQPQQHQQRLHKAGIAGAPQMIGGMTAGIQVSPWIRRPSADAYVSQGQFQIAYLRYKERLHNRTKYTNLIHCLEPVNLINKIAGASAHNAMLPLKGNLYPLYKASEDWIAPDVGLPLENKPGYQCLMYIVDGTLLYDNGFGGEKILSKGTVHLSSTNRDASIYVRNPSKTHRAHIMRLWIDSALDHAKDPTLAADNHADASRGGRAEIRHDIRHVADSDKHNYLLAVAQPSNFRPSYGNTDQIYGPVASAAVPSNATNGSNSELRVGAVSPLGSSYMMSQSMMFTRPDYFTPELVDPLEAAGSEQQGEWAMDDPQLTSRACVDPLLLEEDIFVYSCQLDSLEKVKFEPADLNDSNRRSLRKMYNPLRAGKRRVWIQTIMPDMSVESALNAGRLVINGDTANRLKPGDSAYVRRIELTDKLVLENCGRAPIEFLLVDTPY